jgi:hypothetical protein
LVIGGKVIHPAAKKKNKIKTIPVRLFISTSFIETPLALKGYKHIINTFPKQRDLNGDYATMGFAEKTAFSTDLIFSLYEKASVKEKNSSSLICGKLAAKKSSATSGRWTY